MRIAAFDALRGALIILVVVGHVLLGGLDENVFRRVIYFFHMPIFIAVTGYFVGSSLFSASYKEVLSKYWWRMIFPYVLAFLVYSALVSLLYLRNGSWLLSVEEGRLPFWLSLVLYPYYHLWFVPAILGYVFLTKFSVRGTFSTILGLVLSFVVTICYAYNKYFFDEMVFLDFLGDKKIYCYYFYFAFGCFFSRTRNRASFFILGLGFSVSLLIYNGFYGTWSGALAEVLANIFLILFAFEVCEKKATGLDSWLSRLGKITLPVYLWHVLPILIAKQVILPYGQLAYYSCLAVFMALFFVLLLWLDGRSKIIDLAFYGR